MTGYYVHSQSNGTCSVLQTLGNGIINPTDGDNFLYISTGPGDVGADLVSDGTWVRSDIITVPAGMNYISLDFNVLTEQLPHPWFYDSAEINFYPLAMRANTGQDILQYRNDSLSPDMITVSHPFDLINGPSGITTATGEHYTLQTGWYEVCIDVSDIAGTTDFKSFIFSAIDGLFSHDYDTALLVDNIQLISGVHTPIPPSILLLGSSLLSLLAVFKIRPRK